MNQYGFIPQAYPNYYNPAPSNEYLEQRRISMPLTHYTSGFEQQYFDQSSNQYRSNSMADAMNPAQFKQSAVFSQKSTAAPPGLNKKSRHFEGKTKSEFAQYKFKDNGSESEGTQDSQNANEMGRMNMDFAKMKLNNMNNSQMQGKGQQLLRAATGELSCHSNSTIKEEEFDSEKDIDKASDNSSSKQSQNKQQFYAPYGQATKQYINNLLNDEDIRNQKRRESYQIPVRSLEEKKGMLRSPMKSTAQAFIPRKKDNRTSSMPNIFYPVGTKEVPQPSKPVEGQNFYQFGSMPKYPGMLNFGAGMINETSSQNNDQYDPSTPQSVNHNLAPPMIDYNYEERRNSGTTGGSCTGKDKSLLAEVRQNQGKANKGPSGQYQNKGRRSSNTSNSSLVIPSNDKNVLDYKGQIVAFAKNQQGSKYLQRVLAKASPDILEFIVVEVGDNLHELMVDSYGNYFCQKLLQSSSSKQRLYLLKKISPFLIKIS